MKFAALLELKFATEQDAITDPVFSSQLLQAILNIASSSDHVERDREQPLEGWRTPG